MENKEETEKQKEEELQNNIKEDKNITEENKQQSNDLIKSEFNNTEKDLKNGISQDILRSQARHQRIRFLRKEYLSHR